MLLPGLERQRQVNGLDAPNDALVPAAITDAGCEREVNEDRYAVIESASGLCWVVCDGMGGVSGGELAAQLAIDAIRRDLTSGEIRGAADALKNAVIEANRIIVLRRQNRAFAEMGTTLVCALVNDREVAISHVGDSRAYLVRKGAIQQLTTDHTFVQELVDRGQLNAEEALNHPQAHILTRCIGAEPGLQVDTQSFWLWEAPEGEQPDLLVLCSDGLYSLITDGEIAHFVSTMSPQRACVEMVELAKSRGGYDNITLSIVPLGGQLRNRPPAAPMRRRRTTQFRGMASLRQSRREWLKLLAGAAGLGLITAFLIVCVGIYWFSQG